METEAQELIDRMVAEYRKRMEEAVAKIKERKLKTLREMEEEVSRVSQEINRELLEEMLALKKTNLRKKQDASIVREG